jgi:hypothetical protein
LQHKIPFGLLFLSLGKKYLPMKKWLLGAVMIAGCGTSESPSPGITPGSFSATVAMNANLSAEEPYQNYEAEYMAIRALGASGAQTAAPWASLNPTGTTYDLTPIINPIFGLGKLVDYGYETIFLNIPIITIEVRSMPTDIASLTFDDPQVVARFRALIDAILGSLPPEVKYISLGNEVDTYFNTHPGEWAAYHVLVEDARTYLKSLRPAVTVGVTTTFKGSTSTWVGEVLALNSNLDAVMITYYPLEGNGFFPRPPNTVASDVTKMVNISIGKPVVIQEWGYPSSTFLGSSEAAQADFMLQSLVELQKQGTAKFPFVSFFKYRDWSTGHAASLTNQSAGQPFFEFMSSLGLKRHDGSSKETLNIIVEAIP